jgi:hypothetical protein
MNQDGNGALFNAAEKRRVRSAAHLRFGKCDITRIYQPQAGGRRLSSNHWPTLRRVAAGIASAVGFAQTGQIANVDITML